MRPYTEAPPRDPSTDGDRPLLQRVFGPAEPDRHDDQAHVGDSVDEQAADRQADQAARPTPDQPTAGGQAVGDDRRDGAAWRDEQPDGAVADDEPHGERRMDGQGDIHPEDDPSTTHDAVGSATFDEAARHDPDAEAQADDEPAAGTGAAEPASLDEPTDFEPGDAPAAAVTAIWTDDSARDLRDRWREAQLRFVDDPHKAADDTRTLVNEAVEALTAALASHREQLNSWPSSGDTEQYRVVVQRYRTFFERLLTL
ncbi:MAG TPA: hypothetical protein VFC00_18715 [Micromonosporaceae bacterium]|nr:hypothetical protein [Micromonosporaceae bacterium]